MSKRTLYLSIAELKQLGIIKKYLRKKRKSKKKKQQQGYNMDGIKSSGDHMKTTYSQTFGNQINRNNDINNMILLNQLKNQENNNNTNEMKLLLDNYQNEMTQNLIYGGNMMNDRINSIDRKINNFNGVNNSRSSDDFNGRDENTQENNSFNSSTQFFDDETPKLNDMVPEDIQQPVENQKTTAEEEFNYFKNDFIKNYPDETKFINQLNNYQPIKANITRIKNKSNEINNKNMNIVIPKGKTVKIKKNKKIVPEESNPMWEDIYDD